MTRTFALSLALSLALSAAERKAPELNAQCRPAKAEAMRGTTGSRCRVILAPSRLRGFNHGAPVEAGK